MNTIKIISFLSLTGLVFFNCVSTKPVNDPFPGYPFKERMLISVVSMENKTHDAKNDALINAFSGKFIAELQNTDRFRVIERERLAELLKEHQLTLTGVIEVSKASELGKILGVDAVVLSSVSRIELQKKRTFGLFAWVDKRSIEIDIDARIVDVETAEVLSSSSVKTSAWDKESIAFFVFRAGGKRTEEQLTAMAFDYAIAQLAYELGEECDKKID